MAAGPAIRIHADILRTVDGCEQRSAAGSVPGGSGSGPWLYDPLLGKRGVDTNPPVYVLPGVTRRLLAHLPELVEGTRGRRMAASNGGVPRICPGCRRRVVGRCATCDAVTRHTATPKPKDSTYGLRERNRRSDTVTAWVTMHGWVCPGWQRPEHPAKDLAADHIIARRLGGPQDGPLQVLCRGCNSAKGASLPPPVVPGLSVVLVAGPPCGGKNAYLREHAGTADLIVDYDALAGALQLNPADHAHLEAHKPMICEARDAILDRLIMGGHHVRRAWVINSGAKRIDRDHYRKRHGAHVVMVLSPEDVCLARALGQRPGSWATYIRRWFAEYEPDARDEVVRGYYAA